MTTFSHEQSVVFNQVRYASKRRQKIAADRVQRQTDANERQATVRSIANEVTEKQEDVEKKLKEIARQQEKLACEEAEVAKKQADIAYKQEVIAHEQADVILEQTEITKGLEEIAREQSAILKVNGAITHLETVDAGLQADVLNSLDCLDEYGALKPVSVDFDDTCQTIRWGNDRSVQLTKSQYDMVAILYHAPACQMPALSLEDQVWGKGSMPTTAAVKMAVSRLNQELKQQIFHSKSYELNVTSKLSR